MCPLSQIILAKLQEQIERVEHLLLITPLDRMDWRPAATPVRNLGEVLGHLLDCLAGFCAVLYAAHPESLGHMLELRALPVNHCCSPEEARERIREYRARIEEGFGFLRDEELSRTLPTVFVADGEPLLMLLLGNLEHFINHKYQLFSYLKAMGLPVATRDLYRLRGAAGR